MEPTVRTGTDGTQSSLSNRGFDPGTRRITLCSELANHVCTAAGDYRPELAETTEAIRGDQLAAPLGRELEDGQDATVTELA